MENLTYRQASRFLDMATFGVVKGQVESLLSSDRSTWIEDQINLPASSHQERLQFQMDQRGKNSPTSDMRVAAWFDLALFGEDQLRQRMAFALSQLLVVSEKDANTAPYPMEMAGYYDILSENAFANFRDILYQVTRSPIMGHYLTFVGNKSEEVTGQAPDQNYARELMQLFTLGLYELTPSGELIYDHNGDPKETYGDDDIVALAKIFTGWDVASNGDMASPMVVNDSNHDSGEKVALNYQFAAGVGAEQELDTLLDVLMAHPNTAVFVSKFLITKFVTSNPAPAYVARVASVFSQSSGDLGEVITAILTDSETLLESSMQVMKMREPILAMTFFYRALSAFPGKGGQITYDPMNYKETFNQYPLGANSVFNFFSPTHLPNGLLTDLELYSPEFEAIDWNQLTKISNVYYETLLNCSSTDNTNQLQKLFVNFEDMEEVALQEDVVPVIQMMADRFCHGSISPQLTERLTAIYDSHANKIYAPFKMIFLVLISPEFQVQE